MGAERTHSPAPSEELMHRVLDGVASVEERARFERELATSDVRREDYRAMTALFRSLGSLPVPQPPHGLKQAVLAQLGTRHPPLRLNTRKVILGFAWAGAAAILLTIALWHPPPSEVLSAATMAPQEAGSWPLLKRLDAPRGSLTLRVKDGRYAFFLDAKGQGTASLRWDPARWEGPVVQGNPVILRRLPGATDIGLLVDGTEVATLQIEDLR